MEQLFATRTSNVHQSLLMKDASRVDRISDKINSEPVLHEWREEQFELRSVDKQSVKVPTICTVYFSGLLAFPAHLKRALFPIEDELEFLPILVGSDRWLLLNCLRFVNEFDAPASEVWRCTTGQIFMVRKLRVTDPRARELELFTLAGSNHAQLFVLPSFKARVERLGLEGITFECIGETVAP